MHSTQHTLASEVTFEGIGIHSGETGQVRVKPAPPGFGLRFVRTDLPDRPEIRALAENVTDFRRSTTVSENGAKVQTIEHLMASLYALQADNALIEISGPEVPILDGSAKVFFSVLKAVGLTDQKTDREFLVIDQPYHYQDLSKHIDLTALPYDGFKATVMVDYQSQVLGIQHATLLHTDEFETEIAPCRTFCFWHEIAPMVQAGMIKGGSLENAVVISETEVTPEELGEIAKLTGKPIQRSVHPGILNEGALYFPNEPARHKLLDLMGDLALVGVPIKGIVVALRPGHSSNVAFAKKLASAYRQKKLIKTFQKETGSPNIVFDINAIASILPHRYPFLLVDRITDFSEKSIEGYKNVTFNEDFFNGHFPGNPIMPGVLILEAMAQVGGILLLNIVDHPNNYWVYLLGVDGVRFKKPVVPGDRLVFKLEMQSLKSGICKMSGKAYVDGQLVCQAEIIASLVKKNK